MVIIEIQRICCLSEYREYVVYQNTENMLYIRLLLGEKMLSIRIQKICCLSEYRDMSSIRIQEPYCLSDYRDRSAIRL